jgi:hypothetical protein
MIDVLHHALPENANFSIESFSVKPLTAEEEKKSLTIFSSSLHLYF